MKCDSGAVIAQNARNGWDYDMILVTGAAGFIGSHLVKRLTEDGEKVISLIHNEPVWTEWLEESVEPTIKVRGDVRDYHFLKRVISHYDVNKVFHLASVTIVRHALKDPIGTFDINCLGTVNLLEICRQLDVERIHVASTDKIYGDKMNAKESDRLSPTGPYETSKCAQDLIAQSYIKSYGLSIVITRACNLYGPADKNPRIIPNVIRECLSGKNPVIYTFEGSEPLREYIFVEDFIEALILLMDSGKQWVFNVGSGEVRTQSEVVEEIAKVFDVEPQYQPAPAYITKGILRQTLSSDKILNEVGWKAETSFAQGVRKTVEWWKNASA